MLLNLHGCFIVQKVSNNSKLVLKKDKKKACWIEALH